MALPETYYAVYPETDTVPPQYEWYQSLDSAKADAVEMAEQDNVTIVVDEIMVRSIYRTAATVTLEKC